MVLRSVKTRTRDEVQAELTTRLPVTSDSTWGDVDLTLLDRIERLERAVTLLARHTGATGWNKSLQEVLDAIQADIREPW